jgi:hypothetical protein
MNIDTNIFNDILENWIQQDIKKIKYHHWVHVHVISAYTCNLKNMCNLNIRNQ